MTDSPPVVLALSRADWLLIQRTLLDAYRLAGNLTLLELVGQIGRAKDAAASTLPSACPACMRRRETNLEYAARRAARKR